jgi:hypothetical protein
MTFKLFVTQIPTSYDKEHLLRCFGHDSRLSIEAFIKGKGFYNKKRAIVATSNKSLFKSLLKQGSITSPQGYDLLIEEYLQGESLEKRVQSQALRRVSLFKIKGHTSESRLKEALSVFGPVESCYMIKYRDKKDKYYGFATFDNQRSTILAISQGNCQLNGKSIVIKPYKTNNSKPSKSKAQNPSQNKHLHKMKSGDDVKITHPSYKHRRGQNVCTNFDFSSLTDSHFPSIRRNSGKLDQRHKSEENLVFRKQNQLPGSRNSSGNSQTSISGCVLPLYQDLAQSRPMIARNHKQNNVQFNQSPPTTHYFTPFQGYNRQYPFAYYGRPVPTRPMPFNHYY